MIESVALVLDGGQEGNGTARHHRLPIYGWVRANLDKPISERFGSCDAFEDHYEFDLAHLFSGFGSYTSEQLGAYRQPIWGR